MDKFDLLQQLGAGEFEHLNGSLEQHLTATAAILKRWGASATLQTAGLFHAAYGTAGFTDAMVSLTQRQRIAEVIGAEVEALVYLYCCCDRDFVFAQFSVSGTIEFKDRFTQTQFELSQEQLNAFCELTVANELELVYTSESFKHQYGQQLFNLFASMDAYLSEAARDAYQQALNKFTDTSNNCCLD